MSDEQRIDVPADDPDDASIRFFESEVKAAETAPAARHEQAMPAKQRLRRHEER